MRTTLMFFSPLTRRTFDCTRTRPSSPHNVLGRDMNRIPPSPCLLKGDLLSDGDTSCALHLPRRRARSRPALRAAASPPKKLGTNIFAPGTQLCWMKIPCLTRKASIPVQQRPRRVIQSSSEAVRTHLISSLLAPWQVWREATRDRAAMHLNSME